jgi:hypothetical protein
MIRGGPASSSIAMQNFSNSYHDWIGPDWAGLGRIEAWSSAPYFLFLKPEFRSTLQYTEADLYKQLSHFHRLLDLQRALLKMTDASARALAESRTALLRLSLDRALVSITRIMDRSAYKWVNMGDLFAALRV